MAEWNGRAAATGTFRSARMLCKQGPHVYWPLPKRLPYIGVHDESFGVTSHCYGSSGLTRMTKRLSMRLLYMGVLVEKRLQ